LPCFFFAQKMVFRLKLFNFSDLNSENNKQVCMVDKSNSCTQCGYGQIVAITIY